MMNVLIVGAGPAGLSASISCAEYGLEVKVVDEFIKPGGRLLGQLHEEPNGTWWNGIEEATKLHERARELGIHIRCGVSVYNIEKTDDGWRVFTPDEIIETKILLLATGAAEAPAPIPGWTLPGVMSIGAAQVMTNVHRVKVGECGIIVGVNVLSLSIARELQLAGIQIKQILLPYTNSVNSDAGHPKKVFQSLLRFSNFAPSPFIRYGSKLMKSTFMQDLGTKFYPKNGFKVWGMPILLRKAAIEIFGESSVKGVRLGEITSEGTLMKGTEEEVEADFVCIAGGLYPLVELAAVAGCPFRFIPELGGYVPVHNERMQTPLEGLYVAGNITGIESAKVALKQGTVAGLSIAYNYMADRQALQGKLEHAIAKVKQVRQEAMIQFHPNIHLGRETLYAK